MNGVWNLEESVVWKCIDPFGNGSVSVESVSVVILR